jgi:hypothetical protein
MKAVALLTVTGMLIVGAHAAAAQDAPLVTDRPDFTESSEVVGPKVFQFESGFSYERSEKVGAITVPSSLARIGLTERSELRLGTDGYFSEGSGTARVNGIADFELGIKVRLFDQDQAGVDVAVIPIVSFPTGADGISSGGVDPTVKFTWARQLPSGFGLSGNYNVASLSDGDARFAQQALSVSLGHELPILGLVGYLEAFGFTPMARGSGSGWTLDGGVSRQIGGDLQFDIEGGRGLTADAPDWFIGFGFAIRGRWSAR